jgi:hypothetical protein
MYLQIPRHKLLIASTFVLFLFAVIAWNVLESHPYSGLIAFAVFPPITIASVSLYIRHWQQQPNCFNAVMGITVCAANVLGFHDMWNGVSYFLMPYSSVLAFSVFTLALGRRVVGAFTAVDDINKTLEHKVAEVTESLSRSERART